MLEFLISMLAVVVTGILTMLSSFIGKRSIKSQNDISQNLIEKIGTVNKCNNNFEINFDKDIEKLIKNHHEQAIFQSKIQFWFSLGASIVGFIFIIIIILNSKELRWYEYIVKMLPGIVIEAVSILFFSQSKETRERASDFLNRLREDRQYEKSIKIADTIDDSVLKATLKAEIALHLCGIDNTNIVSEKLKSR